MVIAIDWDSDWDSSGWGFPNKPPGYGAALLWLVLTAVITVLLWAWFGEIDHVVKATGVLRPQANVSTVRIIVGGKVKTANLREGGTVRQGDVLLVIDTEMIDLKLTALDEELRELEEQLAGLEQLRELMIGTAQEERKAQAEYGCLDGPQPIRHRFLSFQTQYDQLLLAYRQAEASLAKHERSRAVPEYELVRLEAEKEAARLSLESYLHSAVAALDQEISATAERLKSVQGQKDELENTKRLSCISAPISGTVQLIHPISAGEYVQSGHELARIVPDQEQEFCVEISVRNQDIALVETGQAVVYRFEALPRHRFGTVTGSITGIAGDAMVAGDGSLVYRVFGSVERTVLQDQYGNIAELKPGMVCQSLVIIRRDKIMHWLLRKLGFLN